MASEYGRVVRELLDDEQECPQCQARNKPGAKPTIDRQQDGSLSCNNCGHGWTPKENRA